MDKQLFHHLEVVHFRYAPGMDTREGWGLVFYNAARGVSGPEFFIQGYIRRATCSYGFEESSYEYGLSSFKWMFAEDWITKVHRLDTPSLTILDGIERSIYLLHKENRMDNLSLVEVLNKLNEYRRRVS